ncbi:MAG: hypothetical protein SAJ12_13405, partial [Jaaginema sp. PMC 1079.18]|nr:hypothetical protein [Jaaginema sp. PMC 1079.18]
DILSSIEFGEGKKRERSILSIAMIIEMNSLCLSEAERVSRYSMLLDPTLLSLHLNRTEHVEIAEELSRIFIESKKILNGIIWAIGKTDGDSGLIPLLNIILCRSDDFNADHISQASLSLEKILFNIEESDFEKYSLLNNKKIVDFLSF